MLEASSDFWAVLFCVHIFGVFLICSAKLSVWDKCLGQEEKDILFKYAESIKIPNNWEMGDKYN